MRDDYYFLNLGAVGNVACLAWPLEQESINGTTFFKPGLVSEAGGLRWEVVVEEDDFRAVPCKAVSPLHAFISRGRQLGGLPGVVLMQTEAETGIVTWAARHAFWDLGLTELSRLLEDSTDMKKLETPGLFALVLFLVQLFLKDWPDDEVAAIMRLRALKAKGQGPADLPLDALDEAAAKEDEQVFKA